MKIQCSSCLHEGSVSDDKIPEGEITVTCPKCKNKFQIVKESAQEFTFELPAPAPQISEQVRTKPEDIKVPPTEPQLKPAMKAQKKFTNKSLVLMVSGFMYVVAVLLARSGWDGMNMLLRPVTFLLVIALSGYITKLGYNRSLRIKGRATGTAANIIGFSILFISIFVILTFVIIGGVMDKLLPTVSPAQIADSPKGSDTDSNGVSRKKFYEPNVKNCSDGCSLQFAPGTKEFDACVQACTH